MQLSPAAFNDIRKAVHDLCGIVISDDKQYLVKSRLEPILKRNGLPSYESLVQRLKQPDSLPLQDQMIEAITTKETSFNRDGHPFEELRRSILPDLASRLIERKASDQALVTPRPASGVRPWRPARKPTAWRWPWRISWRARPGLRPDPRRFSDPGVRHLRQCARHGPGGTIFHRGTQAADLTPDQRDRFFRQDNGGWVVDASLRRMVEFRRLNLVQPLPNLGTFDLILCRNLLIYLDEETRRRLCQGFTTPSIPGILMIGAAESLYGVTDAFSRECFGNTVVYRKP